MAGAFAAAAAPAFASPEAGGETSDLPADAPATLEVVHNIKYPMDGANYLEAGASYLYGDKFLATKGFSLRDQFYFSEHFAFTGGLSFYSSSPTSEVEELSALGVEPRAYDPKFIVRAGVLYQPLYGKFAIGSHIQHFQIGVEGGLHLAQESLVSLQKTTVGKTSSTAFGPVAGLRLSAPIVDKFTLVIRAEFLLHSAFSDLGASSRRLWEASGGVGYRL